jgi:RNA polymerase sigma-70 factor (ECF subfamily)
MNAIAASIDPLLNLFADWDAGMAVHGRSGHAGALIGSRHEDDGRAIDVGLIKGFLASGSHEDFERLVNRHKERVHRLVLSVLGPALSAEAEDVTQDVFVQVFRKLATFRMRSRFSTWLYRIAYNKAIEHRRKARNRLPHCGVESLAAVPISDAHADPARAAGDRQRRQKVLECIEELGEPQRTVVYLHYWMNLKVADIAATLRTRPGTVKSHLHRARARLAQELRREARDE